MLRVPNPVSDIGTFISVFCELFESLQDLGEFDNDDIKLAMIHSGLVTSQGAVGETALKRSENIDKSRDQIYNQAKMYSELFRMLGLVHSNSSALRYSFTKIGELLATSMNKKLVFTECLLEMSFPNQTLEIKGTQRIKPFSTMLKIVGRLNSTSRDEIIIGPMNFSDDLDDREIDKYVDQIAIIRGNSDLLFQALERIGKQRKIKVDPTMRNYMRFPIAALQWTGLLSKRKDLLEPGENYESFFKTRNSGVDLRLNHFLECPDEIKRALLLVSYANFLERCDVEVDADLTMEKNTLKKSGYKNPSNILFSPFQVLARSTIKIYAPELLIGFSSPINRSKKDVTKPETKFQGKNNFKLESTSTRSPIDFQYDSAENAAFVEILQVLNSNNDDIDSSANELLGRYSKANALEFYPMVSGLFRVLGYKCSLSRQGQNSMRADAIIEHGRQSIPIEIKSPGEETEISIKAVQQALENKVILLSRQLLPTTLETTSLVVGFNPPNERAEVHELIRDIASAFNINIGIIDFGVLLKIALEKVKNPEMNLLNLVELRGIAVYE